MKNIINIIGLAFSLWVNPYLTAMILAWTVLECGIARKRPTFDSLRNYSYHAIVTLTAISITYFVKDFFAEKVREGGGRLIDWDANEFVGNNFVLLVVSSFLSLIAHDISFYLFHRFILHGPLWRWHTLHHSDVDMDASTSIRQSWIETAFQTLVIAFPLTFVNISMPMVFWIALINQQWSNFIHSRIQVKGWFFSYVLGGPHLHRYHHSTKEEHFNTNFAGIFPLLDIIGRTFHKPVKGEWPETGVTGVSDPSIKEVIMGKDT